ncbi:MAG TPA: mechanosensitive ion channel [Candidatus Phocaeicola excrementigallinarum]|nr:mechanosensitive ion channel [Candidatus Phocaeicola excrementigallinarum]
MNMLSALHIMLLEASPKINVEALLDKLANWGVEAGKDIIGAILIFVIGRFVIRQINRLFLKIIRQRKLEISVETFLRSLLSILLNLILAFAIISRLGIETTSFAALLASAGVAVGMALSGNLSNFAGGLIILVFKPFKVGDYIDTSSADVSGTVKEIQIFHTVLATLDNKIIYVPNGVLSSNAIINYSKQNMRRAEWVIGVEYGEDVDKVKKVIESLIEADTRILKDPAPLIALKALSASSVDIVVRAWAKSEDYWNVYFDMNKNIYDTFNRAGIGFPFPQLTVHQAKD